MAHLSDGLFTTSIAIYAVAMVGFTAEYAFGRVGRKLTVAAAARERVLNAHTALHRAIVLERYVREVTASSRGKSRSRQVETVA